MKKNKIEILKKKKETKKTKTTIERKMIFLTFC